LSHGQTAGSCLSPLPPESSSLGRKTPLRNDHNRDCSLRHGNVRPSRGSNASGGPLERFAISTCVRRASGVRSVLVAQTGFQAGPRLLRQRVPGFHRTETAGDLGSWLLQLKGEPGGVRHDSHSRNPSFLHASSMHNVSWRRSAGQRSLRRRGTGFAKSLGMAFFIGYGRDVTRGHGDHERAPADR
jgi:hypothetical protein